MKRFLTISLLLLPFLFTPNLAFAETSFSYDNNTTTASFTTDIADCQPGEVLETVISPDAPPYVWGEFLDFEFFYNAGFYNSQQTTTVNITSLDNPIPFILGTYYASVFCYPGEGATDYYQTPIYTEQFDYTL